MGDSSSLKRPLDSPLTAEASKRHHAMPHPQGNTDAREDPNFLDQCVLMFMQHIFGLDLDDTEPLPTEKQAVLLFFVVIGRPTTHVDWDSLTRIEALEYAKAKSPLFEETLEEAWKTRKFSKIRNAAMFRNPPNNPPTPEWVEAEVENQQLIAVRAAWEVPYQKNYHRLLYESLYNMKHDGNTRPHDRANTVTILQSSGTGKSRMIDETASLLFTFPFNLRDKKDSKYLAYPPPDDMVREYLVEKSSNLSEWIVRMRYHSFLAYLFDIANVYIQRIFSESRCSHEDLASEWRNYLKQGTNRNNFYAEVLEKTEAALETYAGRSDLDIVTFMIEQETFEKFARLEATILACTSDTDKKFLAMIYFDESDMLSQLSARNKTARQVPADSPYPLYFIMLSVFNSYKKLSFVGVVLSTVSEVVKFSPVQEQFTSTRMVASKSHRPTITETPFDCAPDLGIKPYSTTKEEVSSISFMAKFGRPMFWTMLQNTPESHRESLQWSMLMTVRNKLVADKINLKSAFHSFSAEAHLAVIDVRLCLEYGLHLQASRVQQSLIASHMRMVYSVPEHRQYLRSGYSSEPIVAEAAAQQLHSWRKSCRTALIEPLITYIQSGVLDKGERGEVTARALLVEAYDRAISKTWKTNTSQENFSKGCSAIDFLDALFTPDIAIAVLESTPENTDGLPLKDVLSQAWIRFTHFVKAVDDHVVNTQTMAAGFIRGMAFICRTGRPQIDILIPLLLFRNAKIGESNMSSIFIQVKRRSRSALYDIDAEYLSFFDSKDTEPRPYITLFMDLGVRKNPPNHAQRNITNVIKEYRLKRKTLSIVPQTPSRIALPACGDYLPVEPKLHPRYRIHAYGCSDTVYGVIDNRDKVKWQQLLSFDDFLVNHPRPKMLSSIWNLKPFWALNSYDWFVGFFSNYEFEEEEPEDLGVFVPN